MITPKKITPNILDFCGKISKAGKPIYIRTQPQTGFPLNECFSVVESMVSNSGGEKILGWSIVEWPRVLIEAELHAVWKNPEGELVDVVPRDLPKSNLLFLPDPNFIYKGRQVDNIRRPLTDDPLIKQFCAMASAWHRLLNEGELADYHGEIVFTPAMTELMKARGKNLKMLSAKYGEPPFMREIVSKRRESSD